MLSGVTAELLKLLFPASVEQITLKAGEQRQAALPVGQGDGQRHRRGSGAGAGRRPGVHRACARADGMGAAGGSTAAVAGLGGRSRGARRDSVEEPGHPASSADAPAVRQGQGLDDDAGRHRQGTAGAAAVNLVAPDGAGTGRGQASTVDQPDARATRHRLQVGRRRQHAHASRPLELHRGAVHQRRAVQRGAGRTGVRAAQHGPARRRRRVLGREVSSTSIRVPRNSIPTSRRSSVFRTSRRTPRGTRPSRRRPPRCCPTSFRAARRTSKRRRRRPRSPGCMAAFTIGPTSKWARTTASGSEATP